MPRVAGCDFRHIPRWTPRHLPTQEDDWDRESIDSSVLEFESGYQFQFTVKDLHYRNNVNMGTAMRRMDPMIRGDIENGVVGTWRFWCYEGAWTAGINVWQEDVRDSVLYEMRALKRQNVIKDFCFHSIVKSDCIQGYDFFLHCT